MSFKLEIPGESSEKLCHLLLHLLILISEIHFMALLKTNFEPLFFMFLLMINIYDCYFDLYKN